MCFIMFKKSLLILFCILIALSAPAAAFAEQGVSAEIPVSNAEDLSKLREDPNGSFVLTDDIDMSGIDWVPLAFSGTLNGNGHAVYNLTVNTMDFLDF